MDWIEVVCCYNRLVKEKPMVVNDSRPSTGVSSSPLWVKVPCWSSLWGRVYCRTLVSYRAANGLLSFIYSATTASAFAPG